MTALRKIIPKNTSNTVFIKIPEAFRHQTLEIIVLPVDDVIPSNQVPSAWPIFLTNLLVASQIFLILSTTNDVDKRIKFLPILRVFHCKNVTDGIANPVQLKYY